MLCPICEGATRVCGTASDESSVLRRRKCKSCGYIFMTIEICSYDAADAARYYAIRERRRRAEAKEKRKEKKQSVKEDKL